jgi:hypothetical protein
MPRLKADEPSIEAVGLPTGLLAPSSRAARGQISTHHSLGRNLHRGGARVPRQHRWLVLDHYQSMHGSN